MNIIRVLIADQGMIVCEMEDGSVLKRHEGTVAWRCNNPGNLKDGPFSRSCGSIGKDYGGHAVFPNLDVGNYAHNELLFGNDSRYRNLTLIDALKRYAPESDGNNPWSYQRYITNKTGVQSNRLLRSLTPDERQGMLACMRLFEGYKEGIVSKYPEDFQQQEETEEVADEITETTKIATKKTRKRSSKKVANQESIKDYWSDET
jgi:hypothetical protein